MEFSRRNKTGKARKPKSFDLFSLFAFLLPGPWGALLLTGAFMVLMYLTGLVTISLYLAGLIGLEAVSLIAYTMTFALLLIPCTSVSRAHAFRMEEGGVALNSSHFGKAGMPAVLLLGAAGMIGAAFVTEPLSMLVERLIPPSQAYQNSLRLLMEGNPWLIALQVCILAPVFEEIFCRGILLRGLLRRMRPGWAILLSAALFALMHGNPWQGAGALVLGLLLGYAYYRTGSLWLTMLMHAANNLFSLLLLHTPSYVSASSWTEILPPWGYAALLGGGALLTALLLRVLSRIPMENPRGNLDPVDLRF